MNIQHHTLASGGWQKLTLCEQLAHIGSEVERTIKWKHKNNSHLSQNAFFRALELLDFSLDDRKNHRGGALKELTRTREMLVDWFYGSLEYCTTDALWQNYFHPFNFKVRAKM